MVHSLLVHHGSGGHTTNRMQPLVSKPCIACGAYHTCTTGSQILLCKPCIQTKYKLDIQSRIGFLAESGKKFLIRIREDGVFYPEYEWSPHKLDTGDYVGHLVMTGLRDSIPVLIISKVRTLRFQTDEETAVRWPKQIITVPVLHANDHRKLSQLAVDQFILTINTVYCVFQKKEDA